MRIRFQADADFNHNIVAAVLRRSPEVDFRTASAAGLAGLKDRDVLAALDAAERTNRSLTASKAARREEWRPDPQQTSASVVCSRVSAT
jgi:hypothetical protein